MSAFLLHWVTALLVCVILSSAFISQYQMEYVAMCILLVDFEYSGGEQKKIFFFFKKGFKVLTHFKNLLVFSYNIRNLWMLICLHLYIFQTFFFSLNKLQYSNVRNIPFPITGHICGESAQKQLISLWYFYTGGLMQVPIIQTKSSRQLLLPDKKNKK